MSENTVLSKVVRDIGDVQSRLFDHRPFTQGEAKFLLQEFEEKRKEREMQYMFEMLEMVTDIRETQIEKAVKLADMHLCHLTAHYEVTIRSAKTYLKEEKDRKKIYFFI
ncbi:biogenesis of lysosome-related organelles complex 1 subunit 5-like [Stegodyphus dumicola]|uniref:biogenesis of lysosome-related organelles complex 1 subunit 5-like n=1 Tax=Stegodyphus dumicola TaxID=202533 RepID=UPI0015A7F539|nr:biogenesis of lysosome-related organelles complex 1 subunit 5-like [Stegodyphus dumicola]